MKQKRVTRSRYKRKKFEQLMYVICVCVEKCDYYMAVKNNKLYAGRYLVEIKVLQHKF